MSIEKRGVVEGEGEAPAATKQAEACQPKCCGNPQACGSDPLSKVAEAAAAAKPPAKS